MLSSPNLPFSCLIPLHPCSVLFPTLIKHMFPRIRSFVLSAYESPFIYMYMPNYLQHTRNCPLTPGNRSLITDYWQLITAPYSFQSFLF
jgi:hypothetical protein